MNLFMFGETFRMAGGALASNRLRSLLALLGIVIGVGTVIGMVALINGFQRSFQPSIPSTGKDTREALFGNRDPLGENVHIGDNSFTVIGEFEPKGKILGNNFDEVAAVPYTCIDKYFPAPVDAPPWFPKRGELFLDAIAKSP